MGKTNNPSAVLGERRVKLDDETLGEVLRMMNEHFSLQYAERLPWMQLGWDYHPGGKLTSAENKKGVR
jgi:hypothetical protein